MRFLIFIIFLLNSHHLKSQSSDIHSFDIVNENELVLNYSDSLIERDLEEAFIYTMQHLNESVNDEKPDYYTSLLRNAIYTSYFMGNVNFSDSLNQVLMQFPKENLHPVFQAKIALNQAHAARNQKRYLESLDLAKEALLKFRNISDARNQLNVINILMRIYFDLGNIDRALHYQSEVDRLFTYVDDEELKINLLLIVSKLHVYNNDFKQAQEYLSRAHRRAHDSQQNDQISAIDFYQAIIYYMQRNYTKSIDLLDKAINGKLRAGKILSMSASITYKAAIAMKQKKYQLAEYYNREALKVRKKAHHRYLAGSSHYNIANTLIYQQKFDSAKYHIKIANDLFSIYKVRPSVKRGNQLLMNIYLQKDDHENAYRLLQDIINIEDSIYRNQSKNKLSDLESSIEVSKYELEKSALQAKTIKEKTQNETNKLLIKISLIILAFALVFSYLLFLHLREKNKRKILLMNQKMIFIQMNSHFVFNALTAIQSLLFKKHIESAIHYLTVFSNLVRKILFITGRKYIGLQMEVSFIMEYLQLQKLRFGDEFKYQLDISDILLQMNHNVPPLLLYPYIEYAIEECVQKSAQGSMLIIKVESDKNYLIYRLVDVELGFSKIEDCYIKRFSKEKISCMNLTTQRIALYNKILYKKLSFYIEDYQYNNNKYPSLVFKFRK